jgi:hypothetical protein
VTNWQIYQMIDTETGEIVPYEEWQRRTCGGLLDDSGDAPEPARAPPLPPRTGQPMRRAGD